MSEIVEDNSESKSNQIQTVALVGGQQLNIESRGDENIIRVSVTGKSLITLRVSLDGAEVLLPDGCAIRSSGDMAIEADSLTLRARDMLRFESRGDVLIHATGDLESKARIQNIKSTLGNVNVHANDDFKARAERILLNT